MYMALKDWNCFYTTTTRIKDWKWFWRTKAHYDCLVAPSVSALKKSDWEHFLPMQAYWVSDALRIDPLNSKIEAKGIEALCQPPPGKHNNQIKMGLLNLLQ